MTIKYPAGPFDPRETAQAARWADECMALIRSGAARNTFDAYDALRDQAQADAMAEDKRRAVVASLA